LYSGAFVDGKKKEKRRKRINEKWLFVDISGIPNIVGLQITG
jgi:hypothetical protein